jgi:two-component system invasion response regulator UvrY
VIRVLVADDHALIRQGLKLVLADTPDLTLAGEADSAQQTLEMARSGSWDVLVLDIRLPDRSGYDILKVLKQEHPHLPILVLSMYADPEIAGRALRSGAAGYVTKESIPSELVTAIRKVASGGKYVSPALAGELLALGLNEAGRQAPHERLSEREFEVLRLIGSGRAAHEIAQELSISVKTVGTYRSRMMEKMNFRTTADVVRYALQNRLVE